MYINEMNSLPDIITGDLNVTACTFEDILLQRLRFTDIHVSLTRACDSSSI